MKGINNIVENSDESTSNKTLSSRRSAIKRYRRWLVENCEGHKLLLLPY